jgi:NAD(P)-dependent dehydrogenase (short-subunit alcohol dehydrogenase family)
MVAHPRDNAPVSPSIIFITSISATAASVNRAEYCLSKMGGSMASQLFAVRLAEHGINVYEIQPGVIRSDMTAGVTEKYDKLIAEGLVPQKRWGTADDVGRAVTALLSGAFPFSTGDVLNVDGGLHLQRL